MIPTKQFYAGIGIIALAIVGGMVLHAYVGQKMSTARAEQVQKDVQSQITALREDLSSQIAKIDKDKAEVKTPQQVVEKIPQYIELPKPIYLQGPSTAIASTPDQLPDAPSAVKGDLVIPKESASAFFQFAADCKANTLKLNECQKELPLVEKERDQWRKASKGSFWDRVLNCTVSVGTNAGTGSVSGGKRGALVGVGFGALGCVLQKH